MGQKAKIRATGTWEGKKKKGNGNPIDKKKACFICGQNIRFAPERPKRHQLNVTENKPQRGSPSRQSAAPAATEKKHSFSYCSPTIRRDRAGKAPPGTSARRPRCLSRRNMHGVVARTYTCTARTRERLAGKSAHFRSKKYPKPGERGETQLKWLPFNPVPPILDYTAQLAFGQHFRKKLAIKKQSVGSTYGRL